MKNRIVALVTLGSFLVFCWSCYSIQEIKPEVLATAKPGDYEIRKIEKTTGETIEYPKDRPGKVEEGKVLGTGKLTYTVEAVEVDRAGLEIISRAGAPFIEVKTQDGRAYGWIKNIEERGDKSVLHILKVGLGELSARPILFSEIQKVWGPRLDIGKTLIAVLLPVLLVGGVALLISGISFDFNNFTYNFLRYFSSPYQSSARGGR